MLIYGIEDQDYTFVEDGKIQQIEGGYNPGNWIWASQLNRSLTVNDPDNLMERWDEGNKNALNLPLAGFEFDIAPVEVEYLACQTINDEYGTAWRVGITSVEEQWDEYMQKMESAGYYTVREEIEEQLAEFKATLE